MPHSSARNALALLAILAVGCAQQGATPTPGIRDRTVQSASAPVTAASYQAMQGRWKDLLAGGTAFEPDDPVIAARLASIDATAQRFWNSLDKTPERRFLWADLASETSSSHVTASYDRLKELARAYATKGSALHRDPKLLSDILAGLDWMGQNRYFAGKAPYDNWWDWEIGAPQSLLNTIVLLGEQLPPAQSRRFTDAVDHFTPDPTMQQQGKIPTTGANRVWKATVVALRAMIVQDPVKLVRARDSLSNVFGYVTRGDGFYEDGSFIQHDKHPYTGGYGKSLLSDLANLMYLLSGSPWTVSDPNSANVYRWVRDSFAPLMFRGAMMDMVRGREISRSYAQDHAAGHDVIRAVIRLSQSAPSAEAAELRGLAKQWIESDTSRDFFATSPLNMLLLGREVVANAAPRPEPTGYYPFASMDRAVQRRPDWAFGVAMSSARTFKYEAINGENVKGWYTADGMTALYGSDLTQYGDDYWATVNPYRLPGTTVDTRPRTATSVPYGKDYLSPERWAGGADLGDFGSAGMALSTEGSSLTAKKSWFFFDEEVVALGAGIAGGDGRTVETTVDNRKLRDPGAALSTDGTPSATRWAHMEGTGGYVFPGGADLKTLREERSGAWRDINASGPSNPVSRSYATLWLDHGVSPTNAAYAYIVLPNKSAGETGAYADDPAVTVLANTAAAQAVRHARLGLIGANFFAAGRAGWIRSASPAAVMARESGAELEVALSDPTQTQGTLSVRLDRVGFAVTSADPGVRVLSLNPVRLEVDTFNARGRTFRVKLSFDPSASVLDVQSTQLTPLADAFVRAGTYGNQNYGTATQLAVSNAGGDYGRQSFLKFDLSGLTGTVQSAKLMVFGATADAGGSVKDVNIRAVEANTWTEGGLTWNTKPAVGASLSKLSVDSVRAWREFDVTEFARARQAEDPARMLSLALAQDGAGLYMDFASRESGGNRPYLLVTFDPATPVRPVTAQDLPTSADAFVRGGVYGNDNYGALPQLAVSNAGGDFSRQSYLKFDLSNLSGEVASAKLRVYGSLTDSRGGTKDVAAHGVEDDGWTEGSLTWNTKPTPASSQGSATFDPAVGWREIDVTPLVRREVSGDRTASLVLLQEGTGLFVNLGSRESSTPPTLRVTTYR